MPVEPKMSLTLWPMSFSNAAAICSMGPMKLAATATCTSSAKAVPTGKPRMTSRKNLRSIGFMGVHRYDGTRFTDLLPVSDILASDHNAFKRTQPVAGATDGYSETREAKSDGAQQLRGAGHRFRLHPENRAVASGAAADRIHRGDVDLGAGELAQRLAHRPDPIVALQQKCGFSRTQFELQGLGREFERGGIFRNEIELPLARAWKTGKRKQIDALRGEPR